MKPTRILLALILWPVVVLAGPPEPLAASESVADSLWTRDKLTGDWGGLCTSLAGHGVDIDLQYTGITQGMLSGTGDEDFDFGGRADLLLGLDTGRLGLWKGGGFHFHVTQRHGDLPGSRGGALWPVNTAGVLPLDGLDNFVASSIYFTQRLGDSASMLIGKINAVDLLARDPFFGGWGIHRFMNLAFVAPPSGVFPPVIMGAVFNYTVKPVTFTFMVYDPNDRTNDYWPDDLFSDGVNLALSATWRGEIAGRASSIGIGGKYSTKEGVDLSDVVLPPGLAAGTKEGSYNIALDFSHLLYESRAVPGKGLGIYGKAAIADGNPNPIQGSFSGGLAGHGVVPGRPRDVFGIGYFYYNFSDDLQDALAPLVRFDDEQGVEVFYNLAATPWFRVSADVQWIDPAAGANDHAWLFALRANLSF